MPWRNGTMRVRMQKHLRRGFTLIELLMFTAIFSVIIGAFITILISMVSVQASQAASSEVQQQGQFVVQQLQYYIESARLVDMPQDTVMSALTLREATSTLDPTIINASSSGSSTLVFIQRGTGSTTPLTVNKVSVSNLLFTRHFNSNGTSSPYGTDSVSFSFIVSANLGGKQYTQAFQSSADVLSVVPKIALVQQAKVENNTPSAASISKSFPTSNDSGDLLLAVVAYQGTGTSSISDTNGNTWTRIASSTYAAYTSTVALYAALNSQTGVNTTTASFTAGSTYTSLFLYEYRGAAISTSSDAWGFQIQPSSTSPVSPSVNPTSSVELLFGIDDNAYPSTAVFSPGAGYTIETSSTAGNTTQVFVEDQNQYATGLVNAPWTSGVLTSSTAMIATFK